MKRHPCFDPYNFKDIAATSLPDNALLEISNHMKDIDLTDLKLELISFAKNYEVLQLTLPVSVDSDCEALCKKRAVCAHTIIGTNRLSERHTIMCIKHSNLFDFISDPSSMRTKFFDTKNN